MARPRTRARKTYDELLAENEEKLRKHTEAVSLLQKEREELLKAKRDEEMQELYTYMQENELSAQDVLVSLREQNSDLEEREAS
ncbi:MAG: hypothetical protein HFI21_10735 [Lachnospiraceae bacterium]|uniref:hypothetical protein n=1 Tax=Candidatus Merdisoma sp. JLR.KK011 TaxID=3114299 RepID=UPI001433CF3B|nr:hypothetical protein [Lachnospiraceae bacterium]GFI10687.1 hypothetical protein IMSAGC007_03157 [Lachnospiraceae bacterium]